MGLNLDYGTQFYANKSQLRNRFTSLHSKKFNQQYILHAIEEFKKLNNHSLLFCQNKIGDIDYEFDVHIDQNDSSHYLKIPFTHIHLFYIFLIILLMFKKIIFKLSLFHHQYKMNILTWMN